MRSLSTVIITFNEEEKIERCIRSAWEVSDEVLILDSFSTDKTLEIAQSLGAKIYQNEFLGFIKQRGLSIEKAQHDFVLALDADEYLDEELKEAIIKVKTHPTADCYQLNRMSSLAGHWLRWGTWYPHRIIRLFDRKQAIASGNPPHDRVEALAGAQIKNLKGRLMHEAYDSVEDRMIGMRKHALTAAHHRHDLGQGSFWTKVYLKTFWKFFHEFIIRMGFFDGYYGYIAALSNAKYIYIRESKLIELSKSSLRS